MKKLVIFLLLTFGLLVVGLEAKPIKKYKPLYQCKHLGIQKVKAYSFKGYKANVTARSNLSSNTAYCGPKFR